MSVAFDNLKEYGNDDDTHHKDDNHDDKQDSDVTDDEKDKKDEKELHERASDSDSEGDSSANESNELVTFQGIKPIKPRSYLSPRQLKERVLFANKYVDINWDNVMFGDEEVIKIGKHSIGIWGAVCVKSDSVLDLHFHEQRKTKTRYQDTILAEIVGPYIQNKGGEIMFVHNRIPFHQAPAVKSWFKEESISCIDIPPCSPDFNIMNDLWVSLSARINEKFPVIPYDLEDSVFTIKEAWQEIQEEYGNNLKKRIKPWITQRLTRCIKTDGKLHKMVK